MPATTCQRPLRLRVVSDLHLGVHGFDLPDVPCDVTILAGDIARPRAAMEWAARLPPPVLYVAGNHEFYGGSIGAVRAALADAAAAHGICFLDQQAAVIGGVRFLGTTLWTDFGIYGAESRDAAMQVAAGFTRDFQAIRNDDGSPFTPGDSAALFAEQYQWLDVELAKPFAGSTVVITHHAPSAQSVHPRFAGSLINAAFVSDCTHLLGRCALWIHGHTHDSFDYTAHGTRVVCNPRGYFRDGVGENASFDPRLCVDVSVSPRQ